MSGAKFVSHQTVLGWSKNFKDNKSPFRADTAAISLQELEDFIKEAKEKCQGFTAVRIYLVRFPLTPQKAEQVKSKIGSDVRNLSQVSLALVPMSSLDTGRGTGNDFKVGDNVYVLAFADPENPDPQEASILCPPKCG